MIYPETTFNLLSNEEKSNSIMESPQIIAFYMGLRIKFNILRYQWTKNYGIQSKVDNTHSKRDIDTVSFAADVLKSKNRVVRASVSEIRNTPSLKT